MPAALDDPTQPPHYRHDITIPNLQPHTVLLKDKETTATIYPISSPEQLPLGLLAFLCDEFNMEIDRGDTYPLFDTLHIETFQNYWFGSFAGVMVIGDAINMHERRQWEKECLGTFYIKPNYPGRCSHICTGGFLVNAGIRGKGIGRTLVECYLDWAPKIGYTYSIFNLVFDTNTYARKIFDDLQFKRVGRVKGAGILKGFDHAVDAIIYGRDLVEMSEDSIGELRFDKIKYYLETGTYPVKSDRQEKSRLRSSAAHYTLKDGKLMLKGKEVVPETSRQLAIATDFHMQSHAGINKTTSQIAEKYHWTRIKETVAAAIKNCSECRDQPRPPPKRVRKDYGQDMDAAVAAAAAVVNEGMLAPKRDLSDQLDRASEESLLAAGLHLGPDVDSNLIAAVAAAQGHHGHHQHHHHQGDVVSHHHTSHYMQPYGSHDNGHNDDIPVDPQVENAFEEHVHGGEEMAIARALIQANESSADQNDSSDLF